jgi:hypothetical protein
MGISKKDVVCNKDNILEIIERVDKRKVYFRVFYGKNMSERNEASLYCFWILKFSPLFNLKEPSHRINIGFAAFVFLRMLSYICQKEGRKITVSREYLRDLVYAFAYRDMSKEAIMALAETLLI